MDLGDDLVGHCMFAASAIHRSAKVVDHDANPVTRQKQRICPAQTRSCTGHHRYPPIKTNSHR
jgi:hypothetical protein